jgi:hypothetical protein
LPDFTTKLYDEENGNQSKTMLRGAVPEVTVTFAKRLTVTLLIITNLACLADEVLRRKRHVGL